MTRQHQFHFSDLGSGPFSAKKFRRFQRVSLMAFSLRGSPRGQKRPHSVSTGGERHVPASCRQFVLNMFFIFYFFFFLFSFFCNFPCFFLHFSHVSFFHLLFVFYSCHFPSGHQRSPSPNLPMSDAVAPWNSWRTGTAAREPLPVLRRAPTLPDEKQPTTCRPKSLLSFRTLAEVRAGETPGKLRFRRSTALPADPRKARPQGLILYPHGQTMG